MSLKKKTKISTVTFSHPKNYWYAKGLYEAKYQLLIKKRASLAKTW